jgi:hypothetical protein
LQYEHCQSGLLAAKYYISLEVRKQQLPMDGMDGIRRRRIEDPMPCSVQIASLRDCDCVCEEDGAKAHCVPMLKASDGSQLAGRLSRTTAMSVCWQCRDGRFRSRSIKLFK